MRIHIKSNFFVPGLENKESVDLERPQMTLREFLEELSEMSPTAIEYVRPGAEVLDPDDWEVDVNGTPINIAAMVEDPSEGRRHSYD